MNDIRIDFKIGEKVAYQSIRAGRVKGVISLVFPDEVVFEVTSKKKGKFGYYLGFTFRTSKYDPWLTRRN